MKLLKRETHMTTVLKNWAIAIGVAASLTTGMARAEDTKIATVDLQKALQSVEAGKKAKAQLEKEFAAKKKDIEKEQAALKKMDEEFKKQSVVMNEEARAKKQGELQARFMKYQEMAARSQAELQQKEAQLTEPLINKLRGVVSDVAKKKGYTLVLEKNENTVLYSQDKDDLTNDVVTSFNKGSG